MPRKSEIQVNATRIQQIHEQINNEVLFKVLEHKVPIQSGLGITKNNQKKPHKTRNKFLE